MRRVEHGVQAKTTKKVVLRLECTVCKYKMQLALKRCKQCVSSLFIECLLYSRACSFELGGEKKTKGAALTFVRVLSSYCPFIYLTVYMTVSLESVFYMSMLCILVPL